MRVFCACLQFMRVFWAWRLRVFWACGLSWLVAARGSKGGTWQRACKRSACKLCKRCAMPPRDHQVRPISTTGVIRSGKQRGSSGQASLNNGGHQAGLNNGAVIRPGSFKLWPCKTVSRTGRLGCDCFERCARCARRARGSRDVDLNPRS